MRARPVPGRCRTGSSSWHSGRRPSSSAPQLSFPMSPKSCWGHDRERRIEPMNGVLSALGFSAILLTASGAVAREKTVTLSVPGMYCSACPYIVKQSLAKVGGVGQVSASFDTKTATVTYDDQKTTVAALIAATTQARYSSHQIVPASVTK